MAEPEYFQQAPNGPAHIFADCDPTTVTYLPALCGEEYRLGNSWYVLQGEEVGEVCGTCARLHAKREAKHQGRTGRTRAFRWCHLMRRLTETLAAVVAGTIAGLALNAATGESAWPRWRKLVVYALAVVGAVQIVRWVL
jgi:hypothetical protein